MRPQSCKAKGRRFQQAIAKLIRERFGLPPSDVRSTSMGAQGADIQLSAAARAVFPYAVEAKCCEKPRLIAAWEQAEAHAAAEGLSPLVVVKRGRKPAVALFRGRQWEELDEDDTVPGYRQSITRAEQGLPSYIPVNSATFVTVVPFKFFLARCV